jgi:ABC-type transport system involved in cytochrome bd biosynthesis fused ATPase/permease subunit
MEGIIMTIEVKEKGSRQSYKEAVNVLTQYQQLLYRPTDKLKDSFTRYTLLSLAMTAMFVMSIIGGINGGFNGMKITTAVFAAFAAVATIFILIRMKKMVDGYAKDDRLSVVTLDDNGVEIEKTGSQAIRLAWDNVAFVRSFGENTCFFSKDQNGVVLFVNNKYRKEIMDYIKSNNIDVNVVKY